MRDANQYSSRVRGEACHNAVLTERDVDTMRRLHEVDGLCCKCIAKIFDLKYSTAFEAITYRSWRHVR